MAWKEIKAAQKMVAPNAGPEMTPEILGDIAVMPEVAEQAIDLANDLRQEIRVEDIEEVTRQLIKRATWDDIEGFTRTDVAAERKKTLFVLSAATTYGAFPPGHAKRVMAFNHFLGRLKDQPNSRTEAFKVNQAINRTTDRNQLFSEPLRLKSPQRRGRLIYDTFSGLKGLRSDAPIEEGDFHRIRRNARRLAHAHILAIAVRGLDTVPEEAVLLQQLHTKMAERHYNEAVLKGHKTVDPTTEQLDLIREIYALYPRLLTPGMPRMS